MSASPRASAPLRVLMTADTIGGVWVHTLELARALASRGVRVLLATMGPEPTPEQRAAARAVPGLRLETSTFALEWMRDPWDDVALAGDWLKKLARDFSPDAVHLGGYAHGVLDLGAPKVIVAHSCVLSWWTAVHDEPAPEEWSRYAQTVRRGLAGADAVVAPSRWMLETVLRLYGPLPSRVRTRAIWNGFDLPAPPKRALDRRRPFVLSAGRLWDPAKNLGLLAEAAPDVAWPIAVAGPTEGPDHARATATGLHLPGAVSRAQLLRFMGRAAIYVHPARYEPFGLAPLEAARSGCALVLSEAPSLREIWGADAFYFSPSDRDGLVRALRLLIERPALRKTYAERAQARAERLGAGRMTEEYLELYAELAAARRS